MKKVILILLLLPNIVFGANVEWTYRLEGSQLNGGEITIEDGDFSDLNSGSFVDTRAFSYVRLGLNDRISMDYYDNGSTAQLIEVVLEIKTFANNGAPLTTYTPTLKMEYSVHSLSKLLDASDFRMTDVHKFKLKVIDILIDSVAAPSSVKNYVFLQAGFSAERYYKMDTQFVPQINPQMLHYNTLTGSTIVESSVYSTSNSTDEIYLNWNYVDGAEYYDLEWTWVDNYPDSNISVVIPSSNIPFSEIDFKRNSTRIRTSNQSYRIPQVFSKGYLIFRVRGIGRWLDDPTKDKYGKWSSGINATKVSDWDFVTITVEHEKGKNWQYQTTYAEDGKKKEVIQYFDGSLRGRQTVTRINSDNHSVVGESVYDVQGRSVIQILPVPQNNPAIRYYPSLNQNSDGNPYNHQNFDWEDDNIVSSCVPELADPLVTGAAQYYSVNGYDPTSDQDWQQYVPESNGYPFTQVQYTPDNTGRVRSQSGVGDVHTIGSGHETKYFYLQPTQEELDRLFGYKVGHKVRYKKNMVVDANGQVSVSYLDAEGRVIATALAGDNQTNLVALDSEQNGNHSIAFNDLLNKLNELDPDTELDDNQLFSTGRFGALDDGLTLEIQLGVVDNGTIYNFDYTILPSVYQEFCDTIGVSYPYVYDLTLSLKDDCGIEYFSVSDTVIGIEQIGAVTNSLIQSFPESVVLDQGSYTLHKSLSINQEALENYREHYLSDENLCLLDSTHFIFEPDTLPCPISCEDCLENLGQDLLEFKQNWVLDSLGLDTLGNPPLVAQLLGSDSFYDKIYQSAKDACTEPCEPKFSCDIYRKLLLGDVSPGGQYAGTASGDITLFTTGYWRGTHFINNSINYSDEFGVPVLLEAYPDYSVASIPNNGGYQHQLIPNGEPSVMVEPWQLKRDDFIQSFQPSWAEALLEYHPEYDLYLYSKELCEVEGAVATLPSGSTQITSNYLDYLLKNELVAFDQLSTNIENINFLSSLPGNTPYPTNLANHPLYAQDPFFSETYSVHGVYDNLKVSLMLEALNVDYKGTGMPMIKYAFKTALYGNDLTMGIPSEEWGDLMSLPTEDQDAVWEKYKFYYLSYKGEINQLLMDYYGFGLPTPIFNGCIGEGDLSAGIALSFSHSIHYSTVVSELISLWDVTNPPPFNLPTSLCEAHYDDKVIRITRTDALYDPSQSSQEIIEEISADADYVLHDETGLCPLTHDLEVLLDQMGKNNQLVSSVGISQADIPTFVSDLYEAFSGTPIALATSNMIIQGTSSGVGLTLLFSGATGMTAPVQISITNPYNGSGSLNWSNYSNLWNIYSIDQSYVVPNGVNNETQVIITAGTSPQDVEEYYASYTIVGASASFNDCPNLQDPDCDREEQLENNLRDLLNTHFIGDNQDELTNISFDSYFVNSSLEELFSSADSVLFMQDPSVDTLFMLVSLPVNDFILFDLDTSFPSGNYIVTDFAMNIGSNANGGDIEITVLTQGGTIEVISGNYQYGNGGSGELVLLELDLTCPCENKSMEVFEQNLQNLQNLLNELVTTDSLISTPLQSFEPLLESLGANTIPLVNSSIIDYDRDLGCLAYDYFWDDSTQLSYGERPCLSFDVCNTKLNSASRVDSIFNVTILPDNSSFSCSVLLSDGQIVNNVTGEMPCFDVPPCEDCPPVLQAPISCTDAYSLYKNKMDEIFNISSQTSAEEMTIYEQEHLIDEETFCRSKYQYITVSYSNYLDAVDSAHVDGQNFLTISEFGATPLGYSNDLLQPIIDAYSTSNVSNLDDSNYVTWNQFAFDYFESAERKICPAVMGDPYIEVPEMEEVPCNQWEENVGLANGMNQSQIYIEQMGDAFIQAYIEGAMSSVVETFDESHADKEYHYTLYYYDQAGNLVRTAPPNKVDRFECDASGNPISYSGSSLSATFEEISNYRETHPNATGLTDPTITGNLAPDHKYVTDYRYNSLNQLVYQETPDGGESRFAYDELGRLVLSQNAKQKLVDQYSYTVYDFLGRVTEVGELTTTPYLLEITGKGKVEYTGSGIRFNIDSLNWINTWPASSQILTREEVTRTIYDEFTGQTVPYNSGTLTNHIPATTQIQSLFGSDYAIDNTRNRIVGVIYQEAYNPSLSNFENGTMYDYDVHGNVKELIQIHNAAPLVKRNQHIKHVEYDYDLVSGNVNKVTYQKDQEDQFIHRYTYDADNRITIAETSKDDIIYEKDAKYFYYEHGPLARTEIGEKKVQAMDYAYTIQGWIKSVNGEEVSENTMMGNDGKSGSINSQSGRDAFGYSLSYYDGDYTANNTTMLNYSLGGTNTGSSLFNGNIRSMYTALVNTEENGSSGTYSPLQTHQTVYQYDQLNRIKEMEGYNLSLGQSLSLSGYSSSYSFDPNGNLKTLKRTSFDGVGEVLMDDFVYHYDDTVNDGYNNRLSWVDDLAGASLFSDADIDSSMNSGNYEYDEIGQLVQDLDEGILDIRWKVTNKVEEIRIDTDNDLAPDKFIHFDYDPMGNRIAKHVIENSETTSTFYALDAQGNPMSIYSYKSDSNTYTLSERSIYGSSRVGLENPNVSIGFTPLNQSIAQMAFYSAKNYTGDKSYELSNHLGNVLEVITDRKLAIESSTNIGLTDFYTSDVIAFTDYYPYGMVMSEQSVALNHYRYGYQSSEMDDEVKDNKGASYTTYFRQLDPRIGRWFSIDPKSNALESPYISMGSNPLWSNDVLGDTLYQFNSDGSFWRVFDDGKSTVKGAYYHWIKRQYDENGNLTKVDYSKTTFAFADPVADPKALRDGTITQLEFVEASDVKELIKKAGAFHPDNQGSVDGLFYLKEEGKGGGKFDFSMTKIPYHDWDQKIDFDSSPIGNKTNTLFLVRDQKVAHNHFNFGNFLFGAGGQALGLRLGTLLLGAHYNSLKNSSANGYSGQPDSLDDQLSITFGYYFAEKRKYDDIEIEDSGEDNNEER